ncbi:MAG TPA: YdcF family protein [Firmicutes bacterium]|jgi:vancomycin permeability regulator SanA|nr:YdcF family protein [Bacillota bacterium]HPT67932.1 YdcF family protein [Bacillota bacterium]
MKRFRKNLVITFIIWFMVHSALIIIDGLDDDIGKADVGVVLGNKVEVTGQPSKRLQSRLDKAVELYRQGYFKYIIVSGGFGKEGYDEAEVMRDYLIKKQVPPDAVIVDNKGNDTYLTARNSKAIMDRLG